MYTIHVGLHTAIKYFTYAKSVKIISTFPKKIYEIKNIKFCPKVVSSVPPLHELVALSGRVLPAKVTNVLECPGEWGGGGGPSQKAEQLIYFLFVTNSKWLFNTQTHAQNLALLQ